MPLRFTNEQIIEAYKSTGSVWRAAKLLGACGQSVWERLKILGHQMPSQNWTPEEISELKLLAPQCTIGEVARRLGRPYAGVASKISELELGVRFGNKGKKKVKRGSGLTKASVAAYIKELNNWGGSLRQFCKQRGLDVECLVSAIQIYQLDWWATYTRSHSELQLKLCPQCSAEFVPMNAKQGTCSRKCSDRNRVDKQYFGGLRSSAIGMEEGICQLCEKEKSSRLAAHHIFGKDNDPENRHLIALCNGCHSLVGSLGVRSDVTNESFWENLISLAVLRKYGDRKPLGFHVCVDIEELTQEDIEYEVEAYSS